MTEEEARAIGQRMTAAANASTQALANLAEVLRQPKPIRIYIPYGMSRYRVSLERLASGYVRLTVEDLERTTPPVSRDIEDWVWDKIYEDLHT